MHAIRFDLWLCRGTLALVLAAALAGCRSTSQGDPQSLSLPGDPPPASIENRDDSDEVSAWTRGSRKMKYNFQKMMGMEPNEPIAQQLFQEGEALFQQKEYDQAAKKFKSAARRWPDSSLEEDALFMQAESYFFADRYPKADDTYGNMMKKYENSRYLERAVSRQFAIARYWEEVDRARHQPLLQPNMMDKTRPVFDTQGNAIAAYESVHLNDPTGPLADDALMAAANTYFLAGRYEDADHYYSLIRTQYPESEHQINAHLLDLRAKMQKYQGPHYDGTSLTEAKDLVRHINAQFGRQIPGERERLRDAESAIELQLAQRDFETAEYYAKTSHYGGARYYYQTVIKKYPNSPYAKQSQERLAKYEGLPDNPPDYFGWLNNVFKPRRRKF